MRYIFTLLLAVFSLVSAYVTYLFTSSLATSTDTLIAFAVLGFAFDGLKSFLPSAVFDFLEEQRYGYAALCLLVCALLISFSLYASFQLLDTGTQTANQPAIAYQIKLQQIEQIKLQQSKYIEFDKISLAKSLNTDLDKLQRELLALPAPKSTGKTAQLIANIALSILLELSIFACHIAQRKRLKSSSKNYTQKSGQKSTQTQLTQGAAANSKSIKSTEKGTFNALAIDELAQIIISRGESALTYRQLESKYSISSGKVRDIKLHIERLQQQQKSGLALVQ